MRRDTIAVAAILFLALFLGAVIWLVPLTVFAEDRFYPYAEVSFRFESAKEPRPWASLGLPVACGRFAPSASIGVAPPAHGEPLAARGEVALRYKF